MRAVALAALLLVTSHCAMAAVGDVFAVLQDPATTRASVVVYNGTGDVTATSETHWKFRWPLVETTADPINQFIKVITFPDGEGSTLLSFNFNLGNPTGRQVASNFSYFDLQASPKQNAYFGIAVSSPYGRVLSQFDIYNPTDYQALSTLPYMWFVNASTFDRQACRYYGLLNNFPGFPNSTTAQKLAIGNFVDAPASGNVVYSDIFTIDPVPASAIIRFIAWSAPDQRLYGVAQLDATTAAIVEIDPAYSIYVVRHRLPNSVAQPLFASATTSTVRLFVENTLKGTRDLVVVNTKLWASTVVRSFSDNLIVAAVASLE